MVLQQPSTKEGVQSHNVCRVHNKDDPLRFIVVVLPQGSVTRASSHVHNSELSMSNTQLFKVASNGGNLLPCFLACRSFHMVDDCSLLISISSSRQPVNAFHNHIIRPTAEGDLDCGELAEKHLTSTVNSNDKDGMLHGMSLGLEIVCSTRITNLIMYAHAVI